MDMMFNNIKGVVETDNRKYYFLKLKDTFFESEKVLLLEAMEDGIIYSNILLKLYLKSLKHNGRLCLDKNLPYSDEMLATIIHQPVTLLKKCLEALALLGLVERLDDGTLYMSDIELFVGKSSTEGDRKRQARQKLDSRQMPDICPPEIEKELELETDTELEKYGKYKNVLLSVDELKTLKNEFPDY